MTRPGTLVTLEPRMFSRQPILIFGCGALLIVGILWMSFGRSLYSTPRIRKVGGVRSNEINHSRIERMDVNVDDVPFGSIVHRVKVGEQLHIAGNLPLNPTQIPTGIFTISFVVVHYPVGTDESQWSRRNSHHQWSSGINHKERVVDNTLPISPEQFPPGDYELRAYLAIRDLEGEDDAFDYLGSAQLQVVPN